MDVPPEDQNSQHGQEDNFNAYRSMRDCMHPPRMSAHSCIVPHTEQLDKAKIWLNSLRPRSIRTWTDLQAEFLKKFSLLIGPMERYMEAINACPYHDFDTWLLVSYFYDGKGCSYGKEIGKTRNEKGTRVQAISKTSVQAMPCSICQSYEHLVEECPTISAVRKMFGDQENVIVQTTCSSTSTSLNLEQAIVNLSKVVEDFVGDQKSINAQLNQRIDIVESTLNKRMDGM
ncbi:hypothetical protein CK203_106579 [Vitis vinifera]|uniref:Retrotransposon gag domain-containing protein n=1 Tax=Vitis vinifera TaxID=29760 RepID=A0A438CG94_VITVI|nr:hypothetical protein CK203_106579 [Vitis vinifera]